jgi:hypothetical protein
MKTRKANSNKADIGERMIQVSIRFWTNNIAKGKGRIVPGHAWSGGMVRMETNAAHGIKPKSPMPFHSMMDLSATMEKVLIAHGIVLHPSSRTLKYMKNE